MKDHLYGKTRAEIGALLEELGAPRYRVDQVTNWLYTRHVGEVADMANLPKELRAELASRFEVGLHPPLREWASADGTTKYLFGASEGRSVESAVIPDGDRATLCLSTQVGCARACTFCMTGRQGLQGNLSSGEILNQYASCPRRDEITNIVYMGMGEPFDNTDEVLKSLEVFTAEYGYAMSPTRLTVSTVGIVPGLKRYLEESKCHVSISLHSPFHAERAKLMSVEEQYPITDVIDVLRKHDIRGQRRLTFEYIMFKGVNDSPDHADATVRLLKGLRCRVNLIPFNAVPEIPYEPSGREAMEAFQVRLKDKGLMTTIRKSKGQDIFAACGMLSTMGNRGT